MYEDSAPFLGTSSMSLPSLWKHWRSKRWLSSVSKGLVGRIIHIPRLLLMHFLDHCGVDSFKYSQELRCWPSIPEVRTVDVASQEFDTYTDLYWYHSRVLTMKIHSLKTSLLISLEVSLSILFTYFLSQYLFFFHLYHYYLCKVGLGLQSWPRTHFS